MTKELFKEVNKITDISHYISFSPMSEVLTPEEIKKVKRLYNAGVLKSQMCHYNSAIIAKELNAEYCEGRLESIIYICHAFNRVRGKYIDVTCELANKEDVTKKKANLYRMFTFNAINKIYSAEGQAFITFDYTDNDGNKIYFDKYGNKKYYTHEQYAKVQYPKY